jgi:hypothetical protein
MTNAFVNGNNQTEPAPEDDETGSEKPGASLRGEMRGRIATTLMQPAVVTL